MNKRKIWLVKHPLSLYKEDVKRLAFRNELNIIDIKFKESINPDLVEKKPPKITLVNPPEGLEILKEESSKH